MKVKYSATPRTLTDGDNTAPLGTSKGVMYTTPYAVLASASVDTGQNLSLADTNSHAFASAVATIGVMVSCPLANTSAVYVGLATGVTSGSTGKGIELQPGDREFFPGVLNASLLFAITGSATQNVHALAI
ncbi:MAG: hypothetical protein V4529_16660 [Gemmatimonadota bacterium]